MKNVMILDGGMGRELKRRGAPFRQSVVVRIGPVHIAVLAEAFPDKPEA